jgi:poly(3-hydroxybutyrate) depolymerase
MTAVLRLPAGFDPQGPPVPLLVYLHGGGGDGQAIVNAGGGALARELDRRGWIGIGPDGRRWGLAARGCPWQTSAAYVNNPDPNVGPGEQDILDAIDWVQANYPVDPDRIYLAGFSMGGRGTYIIGLKNPDRFAAIAPLAPAIDMYEIFVRRPDPRECKEGMTGGRPGDSPFVDTMYSITSGRFLIENAYNLPVFHGHGTQDSVAFNVPQPGSFQHGAHILQDTSWNGCFGGTSLCFGHTPTLSELRARHPNGYDWAFMFTPVTHVSDSKWIEGTPTATGITGSDDPLNPGQLIGMMEFLGRRTRQNSPDTIVYKTFTDTHRKAYWAEIEINAPWMDIPGAIRAKRNQITNSIDAEIVRIKTVTFDLARAGLQLTPSAPLNIFVSVLNEPVFDPALAGVVSADPKIVIRGDLSAIGSVTAVLNGVALPSALVDLRPSMLTIGPVSITGLTLLEIRAH